MLIPKESPYSFLLHLEEPSDNGAGSDIGQDSGVGVADPGTPDMDPGQSQEPEYFYTYEDDDGKATPFKDQNELREYLRSGTLRHSDYTKKTQSLAEERKSFQAEKAKHDAEYVHMLEMKKEIDEIEKFLQSMPQDLYDQIKKQVQGGSRQQPGEFKDPRVDEFLKKQEEAERQRQEEQEREGAFKSLKMKYPDFKAEEVMPFIKQLEEIPPQDQMRAFVELVYLAQKGKTTPAKLEEQIANNFQKRSQVKPPVSSSGNVPPPPPGAYKSLEEAAEAARKKYG